MIRYLFRLNLKFRLRIRLGHNTGISPVFEVSRFFLFFYFSYFF
jgi:hypothetical protein